MLVSDYRPLCGVELPYKERQYYMHSFDIAKPVMRNGFEDYLEPVTNLLKAAGINTGTAYMTVDEKIVKAGMSQRRPGPHVDGCFIPGKSHRYVKDAIGDWGSGGGWQHYCNDIQRGPVGRMSVIVASSISGCRVWRGAFDGAPTEDGDLKHIADQLGRGRVLPANTGYLLSPDCVHESMIFEEDTKRTFLRIALPVGFDWLMGNKTNVVLFYGGNR